MDKKSASMKRAVESLRGNEAWLKLLDDMKKDLEKANADLEEPGEFMHGKAVGKRTIINRVLGFEDSVVGKVNSKGFYKLG